MKIIIIIALFVTSLTSFAGSIFKDALDDDSFFTQEFSHQSTTYKMIIVYSGDTAHGPVYNTQTLEIAGELSDGNIQINGQYVELNG